MSNITRKLVLTAACGALLSLSAPSGHATNMDSTTPQQSDEAAVTDTPGYFSFPAEILDLRARADHLAPRTDAPVSELLEPSARTIEEESRYFDYSGMILGD